MGVNGQNFVLNFGAVLPTWFFSTFFLLIGSLCTFQNHWSCFCCNLFEVKLFVACTTFPKINLGWQMLSIWFPMFALWHQTSLFSMFSLKQMLLILSLAMAAPGLVLPHHWMHSVLDFTFPNWNPFQFAKCCLLQQTIPSSSKVSNKWIVYGSLCHNHPISVHCCMALCMPVEPCTSCS